MSARHAALAIHALSDEDQRWMLERLPQARREVLDPLLAELRELGIPRDAGEASPAGSPARIAPAVAAPAPSLSDVDWLAQLPASTIVAGLAGEAPQVVAALLACRAWPWADEVAAAFSVAVPASMPAPRLLEVLGRGLAQRLRRGVQAEAMTSETRAVPHERRARRSTGSWWKAWAGGKA